MHRRLVLRRFLIPAAAVLFGIGWLRASPLQRVQDDETIPRFLQSYRPPLTSYRAHRHMEASTRGGAMRASLDAWTSLGADGTFSFEVIQESGSELIRNHVLRAALVEEQRSHDTNEGDAASLTPRNYEMQVGDATDGLIRIELTPRRRSRMLIAGSAFVTRDAADLVRVEGTLSKRPSFWTRRVDITRCYRRIAGVRVPIEMRSTANVLVVGTSTFSMTYDYTMINGLPVNSTTASDQPATARTNASVNSAADMRFSVSFTPTRNVSPLGGPSITPFAASRFCTDAASPVLTRSRNRFVPDGMRVMAKASCRLRSRIRSSEVFTARLKRSPNPDK